MFKRLSVISVLVLAFLIIGTVHAAPPDRDPPEAFFNGAPSPTGSVIATGAPISGGCEMPETEVLGVLPEGFAGGEISLSVDEECQLTFDSFAHTQAPPSSQTGETMADSSGYRFKGWAKSELNDFVGIDLASVYVETFYYADGEEVWGGHNQRFRCDQFDHTQWRVLSCVLSYDSTGPDEIWVKGVGHFQSELVRR